MIELANKSKLLLKWFEKERNTVYRIYFLAILQGALYIAIPLSIQGIVTYTMAGKFTASLFLLSTITIVATALIGMFQLWQLRINETLQQRIFAGITDRLANYMAMSNSPENVKKKMASSLLLMPRLLAFTGITVPRFTLGPLVRSVKTMTVPARMGMAPVFHA